MSAYRVHFLWLGIAAALGAVLAAVPQLDLAASALFYRAGDGFFLRGFTPVQLMYRGADFLTTAAVVTLGAILSINLRARTATARARRRAAFFLLLVFVLGPGVLVNSVLKDNWGRARPLQVTVFGGEKTFTPALLPSDQCAKNCSFVSGHAATGFAFVSIAFVTTHPARWLATGVLMGALFGLGRIAQGGHFLSDVVFAFVFVHVTAWLLHVLLYRSRARSESTPETSP